MLCMRVLDTSRHTLSEAMPGAGYPRAVFTMQTLLTPALRRPAAEGEAGRAARDAGLHAAAAPAQPRQLLQHAGPQRAARPRARPPGAPCGRPTLPVPAEGGHWAGGGGEGGQGGARGPRRRPDPGQDLPAAHGRAGGCRAQAPPSHCLGGVLGLPFQTGMNTFSDKLI